MLAINSGMRISELCRIKVSMIDENNTGFNGLFLKTTEKVKCKGRGKDGYMDYKYILKDTFLPAYKEWIKERAKILKDKKAVIILEDDIEEMEKPKRRNRKTI